MKGVPVHIAKLIYSISKHNPLLSTLGILPNQLRNVLKLWTPNFDEAFEDISFTLLFHSYQIWKVRKRLMSRYWKSIAQEDWKPYPAKKKKETPITQEQKKCRSPFHFLEQHQNLYQQRHTPCHVPIMLPSIPQFKDIRYSGFFRNTFIHINLVLQNSQKKSLKHPTKVSITLEKIM